ncbi:MAG: twin-arginine translocase TatA/TatE family subunit [Crocinitomicaceae bacterium]|nr:twin-arginine translocase TatA/TatE family subunit [Crocinitomicaceae bacterium]
MILILNGVAGSEIVLILFFVLIFFGAKSIPGLAKTMGRTMRQIKDATADIQSEIKKSGADMKKDLNLDGIIKETSEEIVRPLDQSIEELDNAVRYEPRKPNSHIPAMGKPVEVETVEVVETDEVKEEIKEEIKKDEGKA